jgi:hypothetical protein
LDARVGFNAASTTEILSADRTMKKEAEQTRTTWMACLCGAAFLALVSQPARAADAPNHVAADAKPGLLGKAIETSAALLEAGDYENGCALVISATKALMFDRLRRVQRRAAWHSVLECGLTSKNVRLLHESLTRMTADRGADVYIWLYRLGTATELENFDDAVAVIEIMLERETYLESKFTEQQFKILVISVLQKLRYSGSTEIRERVLEAIHDSASSTFAVDEVSQSEWRMLAQRLIQRGDLPKATKVVQRIVTSMDVIAMRSDKRFDPIVAAIPQHFDLAAAARDALQDWSARAAGVRRSLFALRNMAALMKPEDALEATQHAANCITSKKPCYDDQHEYYVSIFAVRLAKLMRLQRREDAISTLASIETYLQEQAIRTERAIFLATRFLELDRPQDAARILTWNRLPPFDPDEEAELQLLKVASALALGNRDAAEAAVKAFTAPHLVMSRHHQNALVLLGHESAAAELLLDRLHSVEARGDALYQVQSYRPLLGSDFFAAFHARWDALKARDDVQLAASEVGRIQSYTVIQPISWSSEQPFFVN